MADRSDGTFDGSTSADIIRLADIQNKRFEPPVTFNRRELDQILRVYGFMVGAGEWRDYAIDHLKDYAIFSVFRHSSEVALYQIIKEPKLARKQGAYSVVTSTGMVLKRGQELERVLQVFDKKLAIVRA